MSPSPKSRTDSFLVVATVAFAFLAASFAASNSDLWLHLATGRLVAAGGYSFGRDPFSFLSGEHYWANHSWLFDLAFFEVFQIGGGATLVGVKAAGIAMLAAIMLRLARKGGGPVWLAAGGTLLAVLAMSPRLLLQPQCLSLLLLAVCLSLLVEGGRALRWVPPLLVLWVNVDAWFILGLGLVAIFVLTNRIRGTPLPSVGSGSPLNGGRWFLPVCFGACLASPHHVRALVLPPELSPDVWAHFFGNPRYAAFFASPWHLTGLASWAFPVLLVLSGLSFVLNPRAIRGWRLAVWLPFAALAAWQSRLVPFFAVVAGPILAMNLGEVLGPIRFMKWGRTGTTLVSIFLLILTWPGWLQSFNARDRALALGVFPDPSLVRAAERVRERNVDAVDHASPDVAHYLAWFAPGAKSQVDSRLQLFTPSVRPQLPEPSCAILHPGDVPEGVSIAEVAGSVVIVHTSEPKFDPERLAFTPATPPAPETGPAALVEPADWWNLAAHRQRPRSWEGEAAPTFLRLFELQKGTEKSPALPLLAIRSARTSLAAEPRDDDVWVALARAYLFQSRGSWEAATSNEFTLVRYLRHVQAVGALQQAVLANPDNAAAHELLAGAFGERRLIDLALHHRREQLRLAKRGAAPAELTTRLQDLIESLEADVFEAENRFRVHTDALAGSPLERARIARDLGLGATALDSLVKSHPDLYGVDGLRMLLDLLLQTGRLTEARVLLDRDELVRSPGALDIFTLPGGTKNGRPWRYALPAYVWFDFCQRAAAGRYDLAENALVRLREQLLDVERGALPHVRFVQLRTALGELGATGSLHRAAVHFEREIWSANVADTKFLASVRGDLHALSGLLHLERGSVREAELGFQQSVERYAESSGPLAVHPGRAVVVKYREALRQP